MILQTLKQHASDPTLDHIKLTPSDIQKLLSEIEVLLKEQQKR